MLSSAPDWTVNAFVCAGLPLTGNRTYKITFPAAPPHDPRAFWSVQVFDLEKLTYPGVGANGYGAGYLALKASGRECLVSMMATTAGRGWRSLGREDLDSHQARGAHCSGTQASPITTGSGVAHHGLWTLWASQKGDSWL